MMNAPESGPLGPASTDASATTRGGVVASGKDAGR